MSNDILVIAEPFRGALPEITFEMTQKARELAAAAGGRVVGLLAGHQVKPLASQMGAADVVIVAESDSLADVNPDALCEVVVEIVRARKPWLVLIGATSIGWDLAAHLSAQLAIPMVASCKDLRVEGGKLIAVSQLYGGKIFIESEIESHPAVAAVLPGAFRAEKGAAAKAPAIEEVAVKAPSGPARTQFKRLIEPAGGDVDITQAPVLVSVGRGIQNLDNVPLAQDLADALGGAVSASRPVIDQGWLPLTRQVGRSGMTVKPKLYMSLGISGAPEHVEGMRDAELIVAINTDPAAPIFDVAHYGIVADVLELLPALTAEVSAKKKKAT